MTWSPFSLFKSNKREELDQQVRQLRGDLAHAVVTNDRRAKELRDVMAGALRRREEYGREADS